MTEQKKKTLKEKIVDKVKGVAATAKEKVAAGWHWVKDNPEIVPLIGSGIAAVGAVIDLSIHKDEFEQNREDMRIRKQELAMREEERRMFKDPTTNTTYEMNRPLTNAESILAAKTIRKGEPVEDLLRDLDVL